MRDVLLVRFGEVHLKGLNRPYFLRKLVDNIKRAVEPMGGHVWMSDSRIYVRDCPDMEACARRVSRVFGVHSVSPAVEMEKDLQAICQQCAAMTKDLKGTFKVLARRSDKSFPLDSMALQREIGGKVLEGNPAQALFVSNYEMSVGAVMAAKDMGIIAGGDIGFMGFDDIDYIKPFCPGILGVRQPIKELGRVAAETIISMIDGGPARNIVLNAEIR